MATTVKQALRNFVELNEALQNAVEDLKRVAKEEGSKRMQEHIENEEFEAASEILSELSDFAKIEFVSNAEKTYAYAQKMIERQSAFKAAIEIPTVSMEIPLNEPQEAEMVKITVVKENIKLQDQEMKLLKMLGDTGASREKDCNNEIDIVVLRSLENEGLVALEEVQRDREDFMVFELTTKGLELYEDLFEKEAMPSLLTELRQTYNDAAKGFFMHDLERALTARNYKVEEISLNQIEITKDNRSSYLTLDFGTYSDSDYMKILNRKNQLKNIGFICADKKILKNAKAITQKWANQNRNKCKFLTVNFTTVDEIENSPKVFETLNF